MACIWVFMPLCADQTLPINDFNTIIGIGSQGPKVIFKTNHGTKSYDTVSHVWEYKFDPYAGPAPTISYPWPTEAGVTPWPKILEGIKNPLFSSIILAADNPQNPSWLIVRGFTEETEIPPECRLMDLKGGQSYILSGESNSFNPLYFIINQGVAWISNGTTIESLDLKTGQLKSYTTEPAFPMKHRKVGGADYLLTHLGLYRVDDGQLKPIKGIAETSEHDYTDMLSYDGKIFVLDCPLFYTGSEVKGKARLFVYDPSAWGGKLKAFDLPIRYAGHLGEKDGKIFGYGIKEIDTGDYDGGSLITNYGGAFTFSPKDKSFKVLTTFPISRFNLDTFQAESALFSTGITYTKLIYSPVKESFRIKKKERFTPGSEFIGDSSGHWGPDFYSYEKGATYPSDWDRTDQIEKMFKSPEIARGRFLDEMPKEYSTLQVEYKTVTNNAIQIKSVSMTSKPTDSGKQEN